MEKTRNTTHPNHRYHIDTQTVPDISPWPNRFVVKVNRFQLAKLLIQEVFHQRGDMKAVTSRPCMYGTFSGPIGGFAPRPQHCVGCLRCTVQHPKATKIIPNPARQALGDSYFNFGFINAVAYEAETGSIPVKGAGYRGKFGGEGWDGMWTDMSEIVRPTRDGIHGREYISTSVDLGEKPGYLMFDEEGRPEGILPKTTSIPIPFIYDRLPEKLDFKLVAPIFADAALQTRTFFVAPLDQILQQPLPTDHVIPLIGLDQVNQLVHLPFSPQFIELEIGTASFDTLQSAVGHIRAAYPESILIFRLPYAPSGILQKYFNLGLRVFHFVADYYGRAEDGRFVLDLIRAAHLSFVESGWRDQVTLIAGGGLVAAEHVPKAIIAGADLVSLDTPLLVALQAEFDGECRTPAESQFRLPPNLNHAWGLQRIKNLTAAWRDQLLEILGAMGLREVRRLRGEMGRAMFQADLEREAFADIDGYLESVA